MSLKHIYTQSVVTIDPDAPLQEAARLMKQYHVGDVVVVEKVDEETTKLVGIITDRDLALSMEQEEEGANPATRELRESGSMTKKVKDCMSPNVILSSVNDGIYETIKKMKENGVRRIPIVNEKDNLVGIVSADDFLKFLSEEIKDISEIITHEIQRERKARISNEHDHEIVNRNLN